MRTIVSRRKTGCRRPARVARLGRVRPDAALVRRLLRGQFPRWAGLPVRPVERDGWDNRTFRLGDTMSVRLPSAEAYAAQVDKEHTWLPRLAPHLPLPIPVPLARGEPAEGYPFPWSVREWIDGETAETIGDPVVFATDLAAFLAALRRVDPAGGPGPGDHNFFRGAPPAVYDRQTREAITALGDRVPAGRVRRIWAEALAATWRGDPVWFHGDVAAGNLLTRDGRLSAVIDFGTCGVGDPACDVAIAWRLPTAESRGAFREALGVDRAMWSRARGWALWKALITVAHDPGRRSPERRTLDAILAEATTPGRG